MNEELRKLKRITREMKEIMDGVEEPRKALVTAALSDGKLTDEELQALNNAMLNLLWISWDLESLDLRIEQKRSRFRFWKR